MDFSLNLSASALVTILVIFALLALVKVAVRFYFEAREMDRLDYLDYAESVGQSVSYDDGWSDELLDRIEELEEQLDEYREQALDRQ